MNSLNTISSPSLLNSEGTEYVEPVALLDFSTAFKAIKKDFRQKRYLRAYYFLQQHRPANE